MKNPTLALMISFALSVLAISPVRAEDLDLDSNPIPLRPLIPDNPRKKLPTSYTPIWTAIDKEYIHIISSLDLGICEILLVDENANTSIFTTTIPENEYVSVFIGDIPSFTIYITGESGITYTGYYSAD